MHVYASDLLGQMVDDGKWARLTGNERTLLVVLAGLSDEHGYVEARRSRLIYLSGLKSGKIRDVLATLRGKALLRSAGQQNRFQLLSELPSGGEKDPAMVSLAEENARRRAENLALSLGLKKDDLYIDIDHEVSKDTNAQEI